MTFVSYFFYIATEWRAGAHMYLQKKCLCQMCERVFTDRLWALVQSPPHFNYCVYVTLVIVSDHVILGVCRILLQVIL